MALEQITEFFQWMTIINLVLFFFSFLIITTFKNTIIAIHAKVFSLPETKVSLVLYGLFGLYKIAIIIFAFAPFVALKIMQ